MYKTIIHKLLIMIVSIWLWETREKEEFSIPMFWYIYAENIEFKDARLPKSKRIVITFDSEVLK